MNVVAKNYTNQWKKSHLEHHKKESKWSQNKDSFDGNECKETYNEFYESVNKNQDVVTMLKECKWETKHHNNAKSKHTKIQAQESKCHSWEDNIAKGQTWIKM